jgi:hypothetical protein
MRFRHDALALSGACLAACLLASAPAAAGPKGAPKAAAAKGAAKAPSTKAGPKDAAASKLDADAMGNEYLQTEFVRAEKKFRRAITLCGEKSCSAGVLARVHRDLGVVYVSGLGKIDEGKAAFKKALELDPSIELDRDTTTPDVKRVFAAVRGKQAGASGDAIEHSPVTEQARGTPIPLYATHRDPEGIRLRVRYKPVGATKWKVLSMEKHGEGFAAEIPCADVGRNGELAYYLQAVDAEGELQGELGSAREPYTVAIKTSIDGDPPSLPDAKPPAKCEARCEGDDCGAAEPAPVEAEGEPRARKTWITLTAEQDFTYGAGNDVCGIQQQVNGGYSCFRASGSQYHGTPIAGADDYVSSGIAVATTRLHLGIDRVLVGGLVLGARFGVVLRGGGPRPDGDGAHAFLPIHAEGRLAYWFGKDVFATSGFRSFLFAAGGLAQIDTRYQVWVHENLKVRPPAGQLDNPANQQLDAYRRMGQGFAGGGAGLMYAFTPGSGLFVDVKAMALFPTMGFALAPEAGFAVGF